MIQLFAGRIPSGRALAVKVEPISVVSPPDGASIAYAEEEKKLTAADVRAALHKAFPPIIGPIERIQNEVADFYGISVESMRTPDGRGSREPSVARPRQVAMFFARECTSATLPMIGRQFGWRDHTTVLHAVRTVARRAEGDPYLQIELEVLRERLTA